MFKKVMINVLKCIQCVRKICYYFFFYVFFWPHDIESIFMKYDTKSLWNQYELKEYPSKTIFYRYFSFSLSQTLIFVIDTFKKTEY